MAKGGHIFYMMLNWVLPERCPCCGTITAAGGPFCLSCWQKLEFLGPRWCRGCPAPFDFDHGADAYCASCIAHPPRHDGIRAAVIAQQLLRHLPDDTGQVIITPVPLHWTRIWSRSFNQSALIGKHLAALTGIAFVPDILLRHKRTPSMRGLDHKRRRQAVGSAFALHPKYKGKLKGRKIILIDDVLTTGATSDGCVAVLKRGGADWVQIFCWARALRGGVPQADAPILFDA
jgi:ComF family protein